MLHASGSKNFCHTARQADASTWPDKAGRQIPDMDPCHFINFPKDAKTYDQHDCKLRNCVIEAFAWYMQVLKSPDAPRNEKRTALGSSLTWSATSINRFTLASLRIRAATVLTCDSRQERKLAFVVGHGAFRARARHCVRDRRANTSYDN